MMIEPPLRCHFDARLMPHRSLPRWGFHLLMASIAVTFAIIGLTFWSLGAWPVAGFCGLEVVLVWGAFELNYRAGRAHETVRLDGRTLVVTKVDTLIVRTLLNNCQPYDFWCIGTEPFWGLVISGSEGKIALKLIAEGQGKVFPWVQPKQEGEFILYESTDPETGEKIQVLLRKEPCSDGMSERMYPYSAKLKYGGQMLQGCALK